VSRLVVMAVMLAVLPPACAKLFGTAPPPADDFPPPPPPPIVSATAPPAWSPPDPGTASSSAGGPPPDRPSADLVKARTAADAKDFKKVRALLEKKVRGGKCAPEESQLVFHACTALKDKVCADAVKAKHGDDLTE
jgi:hypothetical protein